MDKVDHLRGLLSRYVPYDADERGYHGAMRGLLEAGPAAVQRDHFIPGHFTASAFVLDDAHATLLLIHHAKLNLWLQPGGHVETRDENLIAAARRELAEEAGIEDAVLLHEGIFDIDVHDIPALSDSPPHQHFDVRFAFSTKQTSLVAASDAKDARWVPFDEVAAAHSDRSVMRAVERLRKL